MRLVVQRRLAHRHGQAAVAVADEESDRLARHRFEVEVDEGIVLEPGAAAEGDIVDAVGLEVGEAWVVGRRLR